MSYMEHSRKISFKKMHGVAERNAVCSRCCLINGVDVFISFLSVCVFNLFTDIKFNRLGGICVLFCVKYVVFNNNACLSRLHTRLLNIARENTTYATG